MPYPPDRGPHEGWSPRDNRGSRLVAIAVLAELSGAARRFSSSVLRAPEPSPGRSGTAHPAGKLSGKRGRSANRRGERLSLEGESRFRRDDSPRYRGGMVPANRLAPRLAARPNKLPWAEIPGLCDNVGLSPPISPYLPRCRLIFPEISSHRRRSADISRMSPYLRQSPRISRDVSLHCDK